MPRKFWSRAASKLRHPSPGAGPLALAGPPCEFRVGGFRVFGLWV